MSPALSAGRASFTSQCYGFNLPDSREAIGESRYNLAELLKSEPPIAEQEEPKKYDISDDVKKMQRMMQRLYTKQKEKGGIIDLEAEGKKFLVVTNTGNDDEEEKFTELSPTDYQLDDQGFPCAKASTPNSPARSAAGLSPEETNFGAEYFRNQDYYGRGRGRGGKSRGFHKQHSSAEK